MGPIVKLLFGREAGVLAELLRPNGQAGPGGSVVAGSGLAEQARRAGQWCASTPGSAIIPPTRLTAYVHGMS